MRTRELILADNDNSNMNIGVDVMNLVMRINLRPKFEVTDANVTNQRGATATFTNTHKASSMF